LPIAAGAGADDGREPGRAVGRTGDDTGSTVLVSLGLLLAGAAAVLVSR
jgi:LPXTG-motif cell wall-anchored protein